MICEQCRKAGGKEIMANRSRDIRISASKVLKKLLGYEEASLDFATCHSVGKKKS